MARFGGDEFVAVTSGFVEIPAQLSEPVTAELESGAGTVPVTISIGVVKGVASRTGEQLLKEASHALRLAKKSPGSLVLSDGLTRERFLRFNELREVADLSGKIVPVAQGIMKDEAIVGCELLARWLSLIHISEPTRPY